MQQPIINIRQIAITAGLGMFLSTLDSSIMNITLPSLMHYFNASLHQVVWVITLYTLCLSASILLFGQLADRFGRVKIYRFGLALFAISSACCAVSPNLTLLIIFRCLQGIAAAMLQACAMALITSHLKDKALLSGLSLFGVMLSAGTMLGPSVGGLILSSIGWRFIFWLNLPFCIYALISSRIFKQFHETRQHNKINKLNMLIFACIILMILLITNQFYWLLPFLIVATALLCFLEFKTDNKLFYYSLFRRLNFLSPILGTIALGGATMIAFMLPPIFLEKFLNLTPWQVGLICLNASIGITISARCSGIIMEKFNSQAPMIMGLSIMGLMLFFFTQINLHWSISWICFLLFCYGLGAGLFQVPSLKHLSGQVSSAQQAQLSAVTRMIQNLSISLSSALAAIIIQANHNLLVGIQHAWLLGLVLVFIALGSFAWQVLKR